MPVGSSSLLLLCSFPWSEKRLEITAIFCCFVWHKDSTALTGIPSFVIWIIDLFVQEWKRFHKTNLKQESSGNILIAGLSCFMIYLHTTSSWPSAILSQKRKKNKDIWFTIQLWCLSQGLDQAGIYGLWWWESKAVQLPHQSQQLWQTHTAAGHRGLGNPLLRAHRFLHCYISSNIQQYTGMLM